MHFKGSKRRIELKEERRLAKEAASRSALYELINKTYREQFEQGDREQALLKCLHLCGLCDVPIPSWARDVLGTAAGECLQASAPENSTLDDFLFGKRKGRHAHDSQAQFDLRNRQTVREAVEVVTARGAQRGQRFVKAFQLLDQCLQLGIPWRPGNSESLKTIYFRAVREELPRNPQIEAELRLYADAGHFLLEDLKAQTSQRGPKGR